MYSGSRDFRPAWSRGGSFKGGRGDWQQHQVEVPATPPPPLGPMIQQLKVGDLVSYEGTALKDRHEAKISDVTLVASFNWENNKTPTIVVPGLPPRWTPLSQPREIPDDNGNMGSKTSVSTRKAFRDENSARFPRHPMEPTIKATLKMAPTLPHGDDCPSIVACGSTLGSLLRFVSGSNKPFRMLVEVVGDTVFFVRRENSPTELIPDIQGYGHSFPEHYTTWNQDVKGSVSHQRVIRYRFAGLLLLVRFEGDGYIAQAGSPGIAQPKQKKPSDGIDDLLGSLERTGVSEAKTSSDAELQVKSSGELIDQSLVFDLKTRSIKKVDQDILEEELPRLWLRQISKFIVAYHQRGVFTDIRVMDLKDRVKSWELQNRETIGKLAILLNRINALARDRLQCPDGKLEICFSGGALEFREQLPDAGSALSNETKTAWEEEPFVDSEKGNSDDSDDVPRNLDYDYDDGQDLDFTACSADQCGYCGRCSY